VKETLNRNMSRTCTICEHPNSLNINEKLITGRSYRSIAKQFSLSDSAVYRHKSHISQALVKAKEAEEIADADSLIEKLKSLQEEALSILKEAREEKDLRTAVLAINSTKGILELQGKLLGELKDNPQINILISPEWTSLRATILQAIEPYPEARVSISRALESKDGSTSK